MIRDETWKSFYRIYAGAVFASATALMAYLVFKVGYVPDSISEYWAIAAPSALIAAPVVTLVYLALFQLYIHEALDRLFGNQERNKDGGDVIIIKKSVKMVKRRYFLPSQKLQFIIGKVRLRSWPWIDILVAASIIFLAPLYVPLLFDTNNTKVNHWAMGIIFLFVWLIIRFGLVGDTRKEWFTFSFMVLIGIFVWSYAHDMLAFEGKATLGYGRILLTAKKTPPIFFREPYGTRCVPAFYKISKNRFVFLSAELLYKSDHTAVIKYYGFHYGTVQAMPPTIKLLLPIVKNELCSSTFFSNNPTSIIDYKDKSSSPKVSCAFKNKNIANKSKCLSSIKRMTIGTALEGKLE